MPPRRPSAQLDLFGPALHAPAAPQPAAPAAPVWGADVEALARRLPPQIHLGTSSWTFPGWAGLCYPQGVTEGQLLRDGLELYARYPLFRTVGIDRSHYRPLSRDELTAYASQLPAGYRCVEKVWERIVTPVFPRHPRYGALAGLKNEAFLDAALFHDSVHAPHLGVFDDHLAAYVFEFPPMLPGQHPPPKEFARKLGRFLDALPYGPRYAVELRNEELLTADYFRTLSERGVSHVYNYWGQMPSVGEQLALAPPPGELLVARLLLRPGTTYEQRKAQFAPFDRLLDPNEELRQDVVRLAEEAVRSGRDLHVLVNNKAEGSAPLTVLELARRIAASGGGTGP